MKGLKDILPQRNNFLKIRFFWKKQFKKNHKAQLSTNYIFTHLKFLNSIKQLLKISCKHTVYSHNQTFTRFVRVVNMQTIANNNLGSY
jgi:hypothetical protein